MPSKIRTLICSVRLASFSSIYAPYPKAFTSLDFYPLFNFFEYCQVTSLNFHPLHATFLFPSLQNWAHPLPHIFINYTIEPQLLSLKKLPRFSSITQLNLSAFLEEVPQIFIHYVIAELPWMPFPRNVAQVLECPPWGKLPKLSSISSKLLGCLFDQMWPNSSIKYCHFLFFILSALCLFISVAQQVWH